MRITAKAVWRLRSGLASQYLLLAQSDVKRCPLRCLPSGVDQRTNNFTEKYPRARLVASELAIGGFTIAVGRA